MIAGRFIADRYVAAGDLNVRGLFDREIFDPRNGNVVDVIVSASHGDEVNAIGGGVGILSFSASPALRVISRKCT